MLDIGWGDLISHFGDDPHTKSIVIYMESIGDVRSFLSAAREVALSKPIIVIKAGRTADAARATSVFRAILAIFRGPRKDDRAASEEDPLFIG